MAVVFGFSAIASFLRVGFAPKRHPLFSIFEAGTEKSPDGADIGKRCLIPHGPAAAWKGAPFLHDIERNQGDGPSNRAACIFRVRRVPERLSIRPERTGAFRWAGSIAIALFFALTGCSLRSVRECASPEQELRNVRNVSAVVIVDESADRGETTRFLDEAFRIFFGQTGIRVRIEGWKTIRWQGSSRTELLRQLADEMQSYGRPFDIAIAMYEMDPLDRLGFNLVGGWTGVIDDEYRKFVMVRRHRTRILVHELGHAFLFDHVHTGEVMDAFNVCAIGDRLCDNESVCFLDRDIREILRNKWRDFDAKPDLPGRQDLISGYAYCKTYLKLFFEVFAPPAPASAR